MGHSFLLQFFLIVLLILAYVHSRESSYDGFDSNDYEEQQNSLAQMSDTDDPNDEESDERNVSQQRSIISHGSQNRHQLIALLRKAYSQGWKPNLIHYVPATRFGRHL
ncbi:unnamed protein product [Rotaria socialis]|nr:unnamed protein product [Rotaria socialis]CAF3331492.1 unnamed protein product [Rotaria socialis]CAF3501043.1 unnamed protein product [Rotaria socialis]CAF3650536.1 unnamed protein product [Rotaria socialis]CAF4272359.1 unnamed protein product [Rotaria socialis]